MGGGDPSVRRHRRDVQGLGAMNEVERWLQGLGLGGYAQAFSEQRIEFDLLSGLGNASSLRRARGGGQLQTRIGGAAGLVVTGAIGPGTAAAEHSASGETPNLAARLHARAQPGEIVLADDTRKLGGDPFVLESL